MFLSDFGVWVPIHGTHDHFLEPIFRNLAIKTPFLQYTVGMMIPFARHLVTIVLWRVFVPSPPHTTDVAQGAEVLSVDGRKFLNISGGSLASAKEAI